MENEIIVNWVTYVKKEEKKQSKRWEVIWWINKKWEVFWEQLHIFPWENIDIIKAFCYPTKAEANKARDKQLALYRISSYAEEKREEFVPDRNNEQQTKYHIAYNNKKKEYWVDANDYVQKFNLFYLAEQEYCEEIIEKFKDDLDILFDVKW
jgi:hypothetical protein